MLINSVFIENFRCFQGKHHIELSTNPDKPIVLFGGLNGAGKTSILTAIKVALFGKTALKVNLSTKEYHVFLVDQINRGNDHYNNAAVSIQFTYAKLGKQLRYVVQRSWIVENGKVKESLLIQENGKRLSELNIAQAQGFIFDLIPLGVANLFFFDGEKISEMADDEDGHVLIEALKKLVGVDLIDKATFDTGVVLRKNKKLSGSIKDQKLVEKLELELTQTEQLVDNKISEYGDHFLSEQAELEVMLNMAKQNLDEAGGAWAKSRDALIAQQAGLNANRKEIETKITELMRADIVFCAAPSYMGQLMSRLKEDLTINKSIEFNEQLDQKFAQLKDQDTSLANLVSKLKNKDIAEARHQVSSYQFKEFKKIFKNSSKSKKILHQLINEYEEIESKIDELGLNISRAPDESKLKAIFSKINGIELEIEKIKNLIKEIKGEIRTLLSKAIQLTYDLEKVYSRIESQKSSAQVEAVGNKVISAMQNLSNSLIESKISALELEFNTVFQRLTRKKDMTHQANINRENFKIELIDKNGNIIDKKRMSSGEKQIYAFSMLEALGRISGRNLPFIIDTPLGRLDSIHRKKLINNFFPEIGEQVIVLSTDTEVGAQFYEDLSPHISKSYHMIFDDNKLGSVVQEGYFWPIKEKENKVELFA